MLCCAVILLPTLMQRDEEKERENMFFVHLRIRVIGEHDACTSPNDALYCNCNKTLLWYCATCVFNI